MVRLVRARRGYRCFVRGRRLHHGKTGVLLIAAGLVLAAHDWPDRRAWFGVEFYTDKAAL